MRGNAEIDQFLFGPTTLI